MAACFSLTKKGESKPTSLQTVDEEMARFFGKEPDPVKWYKNWYNDFGFMLASGVSFDEIIADYADCGSTVFVAIVEWLKENYIVNAWRGR